MDTKMKLITALAVVSTIVAVVEGVLLVKAADREPTAVAAESATRGGPTGDAKAPAVVGDPGDARSQTSTSDLAADTVAKAPDVPVQAVVDPTAKGADGAADPGQAVAVDPAAAEPPLSDKEKARREQAAAMAKLEEAMVTMADQNIKQMLDRLNLDDVQRQATAETVEKLRQEMLGMILTPMRMGKDLESRAKQMRDEALLQGRSEADIGDMMKAEQTRLMGEIRQHMTGSLTRFSGTLEEMRDVLNPIQQGTLDQMQKEIKQQQAMMDRMMNVMTEEQNKAAPAPTP